jgi:hypothetical protein
MHDPPGCRDCRVVFVVSGATSVARITKVRKGSGTWWQPGEPANNNIACTSLAGCSCVAGCVAVWLQSGKRPARSLAAAWRLAGFGWAALGAPSDATGRGLMPSFSNHGVIGHRTSVSYLPAGCTLCHVWPSHKDLAPG